MGLVIPQKKQQHNRLTTCAQGCGLLPKGPIRAFVRIMFSLFLSSEKESLSLNDTSCFVFCGMVLFQLTLLLEIQRLIGCEMESNMLCNMYKLSGARDPGGPVGTFISLEFLATMNWKLLMVHTQ